MHRRLTFGVLILGSLGVLTSCDRAPVWTVTGVWVNSPIRTNSFVRLVLQQDGNSITGVACSDLGPSTPLWTAAPVEGQFPEFTVTVGLENYGSRNCCEPATLAGKVFDPNKIFLYYVIDGQLNPHAIELNRSSDQQYQCPPLSAIQ